MGTARLTIAAAAHRALVQSAFVQSAIVVCALIAACAAVPRPAMAGDAPASSTTQEQRSTPQPAPNGCPFRNGKLELIA